ncbi:MAG: bifunctional nuclease family protein [Nitrospira sp. CG24C]|nr:MAG: bifunctional nuclease family protein [Nitrospira sp. CG24C]TKB53808.1 MAG: bifunctional nuclease family protein [Nitrospira sp.]
MPRCSRTIRSSPNRIPRNSISGLKILNRKILANLTPNSAKRIMSIADLPKEQDLVEYKVDRILDEANTDTKIVVLARQDGALDTFPIWVGAAEGNAIKLALDTMITPRPMSHDLVKSFAEHLNITIQRVVIADVKSSTYYAMVHVSNKGLERTIDARPSDAISLALRAPCPIYITQDVLKRRSTTNLDAWLAKLDSKNIGTPEVQET